MPRERRKSVTAEQTAAARSWAQQLGDDELLCRDLGHVWHPDSASFDNRQRAFKQTLRCDRCTTLRRRMLSKTGEILASSYVYPRRYLAPKGLGPYDTGVRSTLRLASITRVINAAAEAAKKSSVVTEITSAASARNSK